MDKKISLEKILFERKEKIVDEKNCLILYEFSLKIKIGYWQINRVRKI